MAGTGRYTLHAVDRWRTFSATAAFVSAGVGGYVEILQNKSHSLLWAVSGCALAGLLGAFLAAYYNKKLRVHSLGHTNEISVWMAAPAAFVIGAWLMDFRHGFVLSHQYANFSAFAVGIVIGLIRNGWDTDWKLGIPNALTSQVTRAEPAPKRNTPKRKTNVEDLPALIRELVIALNNKYDMTERQKKFTEDNLLAAVSGLISLGKMEKAAQLCRKVPSNWIRFEKAFAGLDLEEGLRLAMASFRINDWGTALRILDWALSSHPTAETEKRIVTAADMVADQICILDDAYDAKVVALQLSPRLRQILKR